MAKPPVGIKKVKKANEEEESKINKKKSKQE